MADRRHVAAAALTAVALVAAVAVVATSDGRRSGGGAEPEPTAPGATALTGSPSAEASPESGRTQRPRARGSGTPSTSTAPETPGSTATPGESSGPSPGAEVPDTAEPTPAVLPGLLRAERRQRAAAVELARAFPALQVRRGALAARHPGRTVPVPSQAEVRSSSVTTEGGITQVGLVAVVPRSLDWSLRFYRIRLGEIGFGEIDPSPVAEGVSASFRRKSESVVVHTVRERGATLVTVHATLRTGG